MMRLVVRTLRGLWIVLKYVLAWFGIGMSPSLARWIASPDFLRSPEWRRARYEALQASDGKCCLCGRGKWDGVKLNVDHIRSRRDRPDLALVQKNLQVLCEDCNHGKGNRYGDWRRPI